MPYIPMPARPRVRTLGPGHAGELNFLVTELCLAFVDGIGGPSYLAFNSAIGALECAKLELYRRMVAPYEDAKMAENGDVYPQEAK